MAHGCGDRAGSLCRPTHPVGGVTPPSRVASIWSNLGDLAQKEGDLDRALADLDRARAVLAAHPASRDSAHVALARGDVLHGLGRASEAMASFGEVLRLSAALEIPVLVPRAAAPLADLLWTTGGDRRRTRELAETALAAYEADPSEAEAAAKVSLWLADRGITRSPA